MNTDLVVSAIERQIKIEQERINAYNMQIDNANQILFPDGLPIPIHGYLDQLKIALKKLKSYDVQVDRINNCRDYLMQADPDDINPVACFSLLGFNSDGTRHLQT